MWEVAVDVSTVEKLQAVVDSGVFGQQVVKKQELSLKQGAVTLVEDTLAYRYRRQTRAVAKVGAHLER